MRNLAILMAMMAFAAQAAEPPLARQSELRHLVLHDCGSCHGLTMKGGLGAPLLPALLADKSDEALQHVILNGMPGTPMPPWRGELTAEEAAWIVRALRAGVSDGR
jgi:mono/diheme cytochrome c family protein